MMESRLEELERYGREYDAINATAAKYLKSSIGFGQALPVELQLEALRFALNVYITVYALTTSITAGALIYLTLR